MINYIIKSLLDLDRYKLTMSQFLYFFYRMSMVEFSFTCRTKDEKARKILVSLIPQINIQLNHVKRMRYSFFELLHLKNQPNGLFRDEYLEALSLIEMGDIEAYEKNGQLAFKKYVGFWWQKTLWETIVLTITNELYARTLALEKYIKDKNLTDINDSGTITLLTAKVYEGDIETLKLINAEYEAEAMLRLEKKIELFKHNKTIRFFEFGTRRRFSAALQEKIVLRLQQAFKGTQLTGQSQFLGTSNEYLAMKHGIKCGGTMAHELFMGVTALAEPDKDKMIDATYVFLRQWNSFYGNDMSVTLTDTFGSESFFKFCPKDILEMYSYREDSATNLFKYTDLVLNTYRNMGMIDITQNKIIVHSNGLDASDVVSIHSYEADKIDKAYGIGSMLSCDVGNGFLHLSIVVKLSKIEGITTVKLSDNLAKAICEDKEKIEFYKQVFGYTVTENVMQLV